MCQALAVHCISIKFVVDIAAVLLLERRQTAGTDHPAYILATTGMDN